jgi:molecular chaperone GrpE
VELIHRQLLEALRRRGAETFETVGRDFDPAWHEALASEPANGHRDGEITAEIRRGYRIGQRLIRPAMVKVAKA